MIPRPCRKSYCPSVVYYKPSVERCFSQTLLDLSASVMRDVRCMQSASRRVVLRAAFFLVQISSKATRNAADISLQGSEDLAARGSSNQPARLYEMEPATAAAPRTYPFKRSFSLLSPSFLCPYVLLPIRQPFSLHGRRSGGVGQRLGLSWTLSSQSSFARHGQSTNVSNPT